MFGGAFTSTSFYAYLTASPFIFTEMLHRPAAEIGLYYLAVMGACPWAVSCRAGSLAGFV